MTIRTILLLALSICVAGCHKAAPQQEKAQGEILPGSASDAMLPVDTVRSQPPLAPHLDKVEGKGVASEAADDAAAAPDAAPQPAAATPDKAAVQ